MSRSAGRKAGLLAGRAGHLGVHGAHAGEARVLARLTRLTRLAQLAGGGPAEAGGVRIGDLLLLGRVVNELPLLIQGVVVVYLDALAFRRGGYTGDAGTDDLASGIALRHASGAGSGQNVADHIGCRVALARGSPRLGKAGRHPVGSRGDRIGRHAAYL